jgi:hypothetical protein
VDTTFAASGLRLKNSGGPYWAKTINIAPSSKADHERSPDSQYDRCTGVGFGETAANPS